MLIEIPSAKTNANMKNKSSITSESQPLANTVLGAGASFTNDESIVEDLRLSDQKNCPSKQKDITVTDLLKLIQSAVPKSERMNFVIPFEKYKNVLNALELCESIIEKMVLSNEKVIEMSAPINCSRNLKSFLEIRENSGELSRTMNKEKIEKILDEAQISIDKIRDNMSNSNYSQDVIELYKSPILILNAWIPSNSFHETLVHV